RFPWSTATVGTRLGRNWGTTAAHRVYASIPRSKALFRHPPGAIWARFIDRLRAARKAEE
ncbi:MAG: hypothetical protein AB7G15_13935, partial [Alphaproteobacteria bacterium]